MKASLSGKGNISMVWQKGVVFIFMLSFFSFPSFILCVCINIVVVTQHRLEPQSQCGTQMSICKSPAIEKSAHTMWTSKQWYSRRVEISSCGKLMNSEGMEVSILESLSWNCLQYALMVLTRHQLACKRPESRTISHTNIAPTHRHQQPPPTATRKEALGQILAPKMWLWATIPTILCLGLASNVMSGL